MIPLELRRSIWKLKLPGPRIIGVYSSRAYDEAARCAKGSIGVNTPFLALMQVCFESREVALDK